MPTPVRSAALPGAALAAVLAGSLGLAAALPASASPWAQFALAALVAAGLVVVSSGRGPVPGRTRPRGRRAPVDVVDLVAPDRSLVGCVEGTEVLTTAVEVQAGALLPATGGAGDAAPASFRGARLPLAALAGELDQGGLALEGLDVVVDGTRAATGPEGEVYAGLVGPLPLVSHRRVHVLVRVDVAALAARVPGGGHRDDAVERVVAVATERIRRTLVHHGFPARVLPATDLAELYLAAEEPRPADVHVALTRGGSSRADTDALTGVAAARTVEVVRLRRVPGRADLTDVITTVALTDPAPGTTSAGARGRRVPLPGERTLPVPGEALDPRLRAALTRRRTADLGDVAPPAHGVGQILGATRDGQALSLQVIGPHLRSVVLTAHAPVCRQVVLRAVAAGHRVAVVTDTPSRWRPLADLDASRFRVVDPGHADPGPPVEGVVWDVAGELTPGRIDALAEPGPDATPPTVLRVVVGDEDTSAAEVEAAVADAPDLVLDGRIDGWLSVEPRGAEPITVSVVVGPGEDRYLGFATSR